jgi:Rad3-related DNA helicase
LSLDTFDFYEIETEFDYEKQALLFVPDDLWNIKTNFPSLLRFITDFMKVVKGRTMVLFTSFDSIRQLVSQTSKELDESNIKLYAQSISWGKQKMIDFYIQNSESSLLVGTNTLWEWVDIAGEDLRYLIIHKIPFMVPSDPVFQARSMLFKDPFQDYAIPKSIIKLKQWFGRLIRTKNDSGIVIFLDDRIFSSKWWEAIYSAFPPDIKKKQGSSSSFLSILKDSTQKDKL